MKELIDLVRYRRELTVKSRDTGAAVGVVHAGVGQTLLQIVVVPGRGVAAQRSGPEYPASK